MKLMSFHLTAPQMRARAKDVTRRVGWAILKAGDLLLAVEKARGVPVEKRVALGVIKIVSVRRERLSDLVLAPYEHDLGESEMRREGFPHLRVDQFISMFCREMRCGRDQVVNRIEFEFVR